MSMTRAIKRQMERQAKKNDYKANPVKCRKCGKQLWRKGLFSRKVICPGCGFKGVLA